MIKLLAGIALACFAVMCWSIPWPAAGPSGANMAAIVGGIALTLVSVVAGLDD